MAYTTRIEILRPREVPSRYTPGSVSLDYSDPEVIPVDMRVSLQPTASKEQADGRMSVVSGWFLSTPVGADIDLRSTDRVRALGRVMQVLGEVLRWPHPIRPGGVHHVEATLEEVTG
ncbi:hypothetical protein [Rhodococcus pyridinivorans]|uniref:Uncharacterized protein n=1 Tax=Rhodococcus pyridinivorans TaxID=103816 RepID=A0A7M2XQ36_9NOCA|nr:hypothetical protein [Rhodococcus pyridinivorans]QOV99513.1 hypothetical protein INP59_03680 [Rhodococcus pyridinivorans]